MAWQVNSARMHRHVYLLQAHLAVKRPKLVLVCGASANYQLFMRRGCMLLLLHYGAGVCAPRDSYLVHTV